MAVHNLISLPFASYGVYSQPESQLFVLLFVELTALKWRRCRCGRAGHIGLSPKPRESPDGTPNELSLNPLGSIFLGPEMDLQPRSTESPMA